MSEPVLCHNREKMTDSHINTCQVCKSSYESYLKNYKIPQSPPCTTFVDDLKSHIETCDICKQANKVWNENAIDITPEMRQVANDIGHNRMPSKENLGKTIKHLTDRLGIKIN